MRQLYCVIVWTVWQHVMANFLYGKKLYNDLLLRSGYNKLIRPVMNKTDKIQVTIGIKFSQLIDVVGESVLSFFSFLHA